MVRKIRENKFAVALLAILLLGPLVAHADQESAVGASDTEIRIGNMPYTGPLAAFATIGKAEAAYFDMINDNGGINGRKIKFISYDDSSKPATAVELTRRLVETEKVLLMFGSFATPSNHATRSYLNDRKIPQLFVASGDQEFSDPSEFPWTMGWQPTFRSEGRIYANYIQSFYSERKIAVLWQDDQFGRDLLRGLQEGLGDSQRMTPTRRSTRPILLRSTQYYPDGDKDDSNATSGYAAAETMVHVLSQCGNDLSGENVMRQSASLRGYQNSLLLPNISINTAAVDFHPIKQMRLVQFDGSAWQPIGECIRRQQRGG